MGSLNRTKVLYLAKTKGETIVENLEKFKTKKCQDFKKRNVIPNLDRIPPNLQLWEQIRRRWYFITAKNPIMKKIHAWGRKLIKWLIFMWGIISQYVIIIKKDKKYKMPQDEIGKGKEMGHAISKACLFLVIYMGSWFRRLTPFFLITRILQFPESMH